MTEQAASPARIILLGPPASGKGTQGRRLAQALGLGYLSTGALLREEVEARSPLGALAKPILDRGEYLPDDLMCRIIGEWLGKQTGGWVLDGFPRSVPQAEFLDGHLASCGLSLTAAISLEVPRSELLTRMRGRVECPDCRWTGQIQQVDDRQCPSCGAGVVARADDHEENFLSRYAEFERLTRPVIARYAALGLLLPCDATAAPDHVARTLLNHFPPQS